MKKILIAINDLDVGGAQQLAIDEVIECRRQGYDVRLLTFKNEKTQSMQAKLGEAKSVWSQIPFKSFYDIAAWVKTYRYLKNEKPDVIISQLWHANTVMKVMYKLLGLPKLITFEQNVYDTLKSKKNFLIDKYTQTWCSKIVASSPAVLDSLIRHSIYKDNIELIYNAINISKFNIEKQNQIKDELTLPKDKLIFVIIGRLVHQKGYDILLRAFKDVDENCYLVSAGWGSEEENIKKLCRDLELENRVKFLGAYNNVPGLLSIADAYVMPSRHEGFSIALLEAMAAKKAIIVSDFEAGRQVVKDGENALVVPVGDSVALAKAMNRLYNDKDLGDKLQAGAFATVQKYGIENYINKILKL